VYMDLILKKFEDFIFYFWNMAQLHLLVLNTLFDLVQHGFQLFWRHYHHLEWPFQQFLQAIRSCKEFCHEGLSHWKCVYGPYLEKFWRFYFLFLKYGDIFISDGECAALYVLFDDISKGRTITLGPKLLTQT
jgi:hypothetical protein